MAKSIDELKTLLSYIEPSPNLKLGLTTDDTHNLGILSQSDDIVLAMRAVEALCKLNDEKAFTHIQKAIDRNIPVLKIAVAVGSKFLPKKNFEKVVPYLLEDLDLGVRKITLKSLPKDISIPIKNQIKKIALTDNSIAVQKIAAKIIEK